MPSLEFAPWVAAALGLGSLLAAAYAFTVAFRLRRTAARASTLFFGDHKLSASDSSRSLFATWMSVGNVIVGALIIAISYQYLSAWAVLTWAAGFLILSWHAPRIIGKASGFTTIHSFIRHSFNSRALGRITSLLAVVTAAGVIALELIVGAALFNAAGLFGSPVIIIPLYVVLLAIVATVYTRLGGLSAVIATDRVQSIGIGISIIALLILSAFAPESTTASVGEAVQQAGKAEPVSHQTFALVAFFIGFGAFQLFLLLGDMTTWQRVQLGHDASSVRSAARRTAVANLIAWSALLFTGLFLLNWPADVIKLPEVGVDLASTLEAQAEPLTSMLAGAGTATTGLPKPLALVLIAVVAFGLFSAVLSTCDSFLLIGVQALLFEWSKPGATLRDTTALTDSPTDAELARRAHRLLPVFMLLSLTIFGLVVVAGVPLISLIFFVFACQCAVSPIAVVALYGDGLSLGARRVAIWSLITATAIIVFLFLLSGVATSLSLAYAYSYTAPIVAIGVPIVSFVVFGLVSRTARKLMALPIWMVFPPRTNTVSHNASSALYREP